VGLNPGAGLLDSRETGECWTNVSCFSFFLIRGKKDIVSRNCNCNCPKSQP